MALGPNSIEVDFGMTWMKTVYPDNMGETVHLHTFVLIIQGKEITYGQGCF